MKHWTFYLPESGTIAQEGEKQAALQAQIAEHKRAILLLEEAYKKNELQIMDVAQKHWNATEIADAMHRTADPATAIISDEVKEALIKSFAGRSDRIKLEATVFYLVSRIHLPLRDWRMDSVEMSSDFDFIAKGFLKKGKKLQKYFLWHTPHWIDALDKIYNGSFPVDVAVKYLRQGAEIQDVNAEILYSNSKEVAEQALKDGFHVKGMTGVAGYAAYIFLKEKASAESFLEPKGRELLFTATLKFK
jgi:hypothetical protein